MHTKKTVLRVLRNNMGAIRGFGVGRIGLFGSVARGEAAAGDLDILVEFDRKSFDGYMDLKEYLEKLFNCPVDLVIAEALKPRLRDAVLKETAYVS